MIKIFFLVACSTFYKPILLTEFLQEINQRVNFNTALSNDAMREFEKSIKGIMVEPIHLTKKKRFIIRGLTTPASQITFTLRDENDRVTTVSDFFSSTGRPLR